MLTVLLESMNGGGQRVANTLYHHHIIQRKIDVITYNDPDIETFIQSYAN